jgi:hypothetical protein
VQSLVTSYVSLASITESDSSTFFPPAEVVSLGSVSFLSGPPVYCDGQEIVAGPLMVSDFLCHIVSMFCGGPNAGTLGGYVSLG